MVKGCVRRFCEQKAKALVDSGTTSENCDDICEQLNNFVMKNLLETD